VSRRRLLGVLADAIEAERGVMDTLSDRFSAKLSRRARIARNGGSARIRIISLLTKGPMTPEAIGAAFGCPDRLPCAVRQGLCRLRKHRTVKVNKAGEYVLRASAVAA